MRAASLVVALVVASGGMAIVAATADAVQRPSLRSWAVGLIVTALAIAAVVGIQAWEASL